MVNAKPTLIKQHKRLKSFVGTVAILVAALVATACQPAEQTPAPQGFGGNGQRSNFQLQPAPELPTDQPALRGMLISMNGALLTVQEGGGFGGAGFNGGNFGGGNGTPRARPTPNGTPRARPTAGPITDVEVDASSATVYEDTTFANLNGQPPSGTLQQTVVASSLDKIPADARVTIWGTLNGTQATAKVIVYTQSRNPQQQ